MGILQVFSTLFHYESLEPLVLIGIRSEIWVGKKVRYCPDTSH
jgi:hypothetical protein